MPAQVTRHKKKMEQTDDTLTEAEQIVAKATQ